MEDMLYKEYTVATYIPGKKLHISSNIYIQYNLADFTLL